MDIERRTLLTGALGVALGIGLDRLGILASQKVAPKDQQARIQEQFIRLSPVGQVELWEARSTDKFIKIFDEIFFRLDKAKLTSKLANTPDSFTREVSEVRFVGWLPTVTRVHMVKGTLHDPKRSALMFRQISIQERDRKIIDEQLIGEQLTSLREVSGQDWLEASRSLMKYYNNFVDEHNTMVERREEYEANPDKFKG